MAKLVIEVETDDNATQMVAKLSKDTTAAHTAIREIINLMEGMASGTMNGAMNVKLGAVQASKTGTFTGDPTAAQTVTVNGVVFTARASGAVADEFNIAGTVGGNATNLAAAINASTTAGVVDVIVASAALGVVTLTSKQAGKVGNAVVLAEGLSNFTWAANALAGGTQSTNKTYLYGKAATTAY